VISPNKIVNPGDSLITNNSVILANPIALRGVGPFD